MRRATNAGLRLAVVALASTLATVVGAGLLASCTEQVVAVVDTQVIDTTIPQGDAAVAVMQSYATSSMAALGDAYRQAIKDEEVSPAVLLLLADGFFGTAREAEEANLRDAIEVRNSLARLPGDPELVIDIVTDQAEHCFIAEAVFDDRPLLAFPTAIQGIPVVVRIRYNPNDELWRIDELISAVKADDNPLRCPLPGEVEQETAVATTRT
jgi:hypothetical protein